MQDKGGFRVFDPALSGPDSFIVSVIKYIRHTHNGLDLRDGHHLDLPDHLRPLFSKWDTSSSPLFVLFRAVASALVARSNAARTDDDPSNPLTLDSLVFSTNLYKLQH